jgi:hypothetical protein
MSRLLYIVFLFLLITNLSGCASDVNAQPSPKTPENLQPSTLHEGEFGPVNWFIGGAGKSVRVFTSQLEYETELANYSSEPAAAVNFSSNRVLLVTTGERNSTGHSVSVTEAEEYDRYVMAYVEISEPGDNCVTGDAITHPYRFVLVPAPKIVLISESQVTINCE